MRKDRIASLLSREISKIIEQDIKDPRLGLITITTVDVTHDLKKATIYFSSLGNKREGLEMLNHAKGYIKSSLAHRIRMRFIPDIEFKIDDSFEYGKKIDALLDDISKDDTEQ